MLGTSITTLILPATSTHGHWGLQLCTMDHVVAGVDRSVSRGLGWMPLYAIRFNWSNVRKWANTNNICSYIVSYTWIYSQCVCHDEPKPWFGLDEQIIRWSGNSSFATKTVWSCGLDLWGFCGIQHIDIETHQIVMSVSTPWVSQHRISINAIATDRNSRCSLRRWSWRHKDVT